MPTYRAGFAHPLEDLRDEFDRFWNTLTAAPPLHGWGTRLAGPAFPAVNVSESDDAVTVEAELPGLAAGDVEISMVDDELVLSGARPEAAAAEGAAASTGNGERRSAVTWHRRERGSGRFERRIPLPVAVDAGPVEARLVDGVLTVTCPKAPEAKPRKVEVKSA
jgi:HSP20 family protein